MHNNHPDWRLQGRYFETCNCEVACPCIWLQPPSEGECKLLVAWHIDDGYLENVRLDNLNVALACFAVGNMIAGGWSAALYIDDRADSEQTEAISRIFSGQAGGHPSVLMGFVGEVWGIQQAAMTYYEQGDIRRLSIPGIAEAEIQSIVGLKGGEALIENPPLCVVTSHPATVARSIRYRYQDHDQDWTFSERNGFHSAFVYQP
ncbi:MAG: DUF1326 domain-containing protein [Methylococcales bacterium]|nr:DUF1326 domain-containing protein [Methylococcales bacterium]